MAIIQAGKTALQIAHYHGYLDIVEQLESCTEVHKNEQRKERCGILILIYRLRMLILHSPVYIQNQGTNRYNIMTQP